MLLRGFSSVRRRAVSNMRRSARAFSSLSGFPDIEVSSVDGLKVATFNTGSPLMAISAQFAFGSRHCPEEMWGLPAFFADRTLESAVQFSQVELFRRSQQLGAEFGTNAGRELMEYWANGHPKDVEPIVQMFGDIVCNPQFRVEELQNGRVEMADKIRGAEENETGDSVLADGLHAAAFGDTLLGAPTMPDVKHLGEFEVEALGMRHRLHIRRENGAVVACGVNHEELVELVAKYMEGFGGDLTNPDPDDAVFTSWKDTLGLSRGNVAGNIPSQFIGGERRFYRPMSSELMMAVGFPGVSFEKPEDVVAITALQFLMGGDTSFSSGGPGKGLQSRLYREVLRRHYEVDQIMCFASAYADAGLFSLIGGTSAAGPDLLENLFVEQAAGLCRRPTDEEVSRAKQQLTATWLMHLESQTEYMAEIGRQLCYLDRVSPIQEVLDALDDLTAEKLEALGNKIIGAGALNPALASYGRTTNVSPQHAFARKLCSRPEVQDAVHQHLKDQQAAQGGN